MPRFESSEAAAREYLIALAAQDWHRAAAAVDPAFLRRFIDGVLFPYPGPLDDVADSAISHIVHGASTRGDVLAMTPLEAFARCLESFGTDWTVEGQTNVPRPVLLREILGSANAEAVTYVVYRAGLDDASAMPFVLPTVKSVEDGWRVLPRGDVLAPEPDTIFADPFREFW